MTAPMLGLAADPNYGFLQFLWPARGTDVRVVKVDDAGHFFTEEQPEFVVGRLIRFFG